MVKIAFDEPAPIETEDMLSIRLTKRAAERIAEILEAEKMTGTHVLRVIVEGGGCSGFSYKFKLVEQNEKDVSDIVISNDEVEGIEVLIDMMSFNYLKGSTIEFEETIEASQFVINNPNASSSCGCGNSFSL